MNGLIKMSVNFSKEVVDAIRALAERRGTTMTEVLRQAIGAAKYFDDVQAKGGKVLVRDKKGRLKEVIFR